jgi:hypothetical protein
MTKLFIITYKTDATFNPVLFHNYIHQLFVKNWISDWWHYTDNTYIVASQQDVVGLYNATFPGIPRRYILIIEVDPNNAQGWLPQSAWTWLQKYQNKK